MALQSGPLAKALCVNAQSTNSARVVLIWLPLRATLPTAYPQSKQATFTRATERSAPSALAPHAAKTIAPLLLLAGTEARLPSRGLLAWRGGYGLDLFFLRFL